MQHITRGYTIMTYIMRYIIMRHIYIYYLSLYDIYIYCISLWIIGMYHEIHGGFQSMGAPLNHPCFFDFPWNKPTILETPICGHPHIMRYKFDDIWDIMGSGTMGLLKVIFVPKNGGKLRKSVWRYHIAADTMRLGQKLFQNWGNE